MNCPTCYVTMVTLKDTTSSITALRNRKFLESQAVLKKVVNTLIKEYRVSKIVLIGSLADKHRFGFHSDIDLCVEGLTDKVYFWSWDDYGDRLVTNLNKLYSSLRSE